MILIDPLEWRPTGRAHPSRKRWAHMVSDRSLDELHEMAAALGLKRQWFQNGRHPHYDLRPHKWDVALRGGASVVSPRELVRRVVK